MNISGTPRRKAGHFLACGERLRPRRHYRPARTTEFLTWLWPVIQHAMMYGKGREQALAVEIVLHAEMLGLVTVVRESEAPADVLLRIERDRLLREHLADEHRDITEHSGDGGAA